MLPSLVPEAAKCGFCGLGRWQQLALGMWLGILLIISGRAVLSQRAHGVYPIFAEAGRHWVEGTELYRPGVEPYRYSPLVTLLFAPFGRLPDAIGGTLWRLLNATVYLGALLWWYRVATVSGRNALSGTHQAILFLLVIPLSVGNLNNGQSNALVIGLLLAAVAGVASQRWNLASICLALATLFKIYPLALGLLLALIFPRRLAGRLALALAVGFFLPFCFQQPAYVLSQYQSWMVHLRADDRHLMSEDFWYRDVRLLGHALGLEIAPVIYLILQLLSALALGAFTFWASRASGDRNRLLNLVFALAVCWMTLIGSATEACTYMLLAPSLAWTILQIDYRRGSWLPHCLLFGAYGLFTLAQMSVWFPGSRQGTHALAVHPLAGSLFLIYLLVHELWGWSYGGFTASIRGTTTLSAT
jgi:hypothetical protein